jgi:hypothetical protein
MAEKLLDLGSDLSASDMARCSSRAAFYRERIKERGQDVRPRACACHHGASPLEPDEGDQPGRIGGTAISC